MKIRVGLAEDNAFLARSLATKIALFAGMELHFHALNGRDLLQKLEQNVHPAVILMDIEMPEMNGIEATARVRKLYPHIKVIMLTVFDDEENIFQSILAGADGYLLKDEPMAKLEEGIRMILEGGAPMSATIAARALRLLREPQRASAPPAEDFGLSERETGILEQLVAGLNYNQIADNLIISPKTVRKHIENIYRKLQVHNKAEAIQKANQHKLI
ncbi:MAG: response regulator transcription factor [Bacteroidia bacterium]|nr:response regulator transcription factor [Bacteroidia bacterium]